MNWNSCASLEDALRAGLAEKEFEHILSLVGRDISILEVGIFAALYSEHCSYKSTKAHLKHLPTEGERVVHGPGENAGVIDIGDGDVVVFKIESHNHPSFIEPFQGAATGVGGILRDVFTMGARPIALLNALRFGRLGSKDGETNSKSKYLLQNAVGGIGHYGNCVGVPTVGGELFLHESYDGNCLVNAFALGIAKRDQIFLGKASGPGNLLMYVGSKTGRDGIHGATMSSETFDEGSDEKRPTVQVGDPFQEKLLIEACLEVMKKGAVLGIQDMGAAGMTSSSYEIADRGGVGLRIDLNLVPQRESNMNPYEIMLSESQERMLLVVEKGKEQVVLDVFSHWGLDAVVIGEVTETQTVDLFWSGECISSLSPSLLTRAAPQYRWPEEKPADYDQRLNFPVGSIPPPEDLSVFWLELLGSDNVCSRRPVYRQYDSTVRTNTVIHPGGDAAVVRIKRESGRGIEKGIAISLDCNSRYCSLDPRVGTALSVVESYRNISAVGAEPIGISNCLNFGSPVKPEGMWQIAEAIRGLGDAGRALGVPIVSGNVSLNNETRGKAILPTPQIAMVGLLPDASKAVTIHFKDDGDLVFVLGDFNADDLGGSEYLAQHAGVEKGVLPRLDYDRELRTSALVRKLISNELLKSCHDLSQGGLAVSLAEACFNPVKPHGVTVGFEEKSKLEAHETLFCETGARYLISISPKDEAKVRELCKIEEAKISMSGRIGGSIIDVQGIAKLSLFEARNKWLFGLDKYFGSPVNLKELHSVGGSVGKKDALDLAKFDVGFY